MISNLENKTSNKQSNKRSNALGNRDSWMRINKS